MLTTKQLAPIFPRNRHLDQWARPLTDACVQFDIDTPLRQAHFLSQLAVESNELQTLEENLHYSPQRLIAIWPKRFRTIPEASRYARNPERLADFVYAGRLGNGDEASRDGWRYRGRGAIQVTGRANYDAIGVALEQNLLNTPDMLLEPKWAALSAAAFWARNGINELADKDDCVAVTKKVNGGTHGLAERERYLVKAKEVLCVTDSSGLDQSDPAGAIRPTGGQENPAPQASGWFD
jgi:putative chitinase